MIHIYHNPRCSKSRLGLQLLEESSKKYEIIKYLDNYLSVEELKNVLNVLNIPPIELVRKNESIWKEHYKNKKLSDEEIIEAMVNNPKLIERPIVVNGNKAVIGRPTERILTII